MKAFKWSRKDHLHSIPMVVLHIQYSNVISQYFRSVPSHCQVCVVTAMLTDKELCELQEVTYMPVLPVHPGLPKKSPLKEIVKIGIRKIYETGVLAYHWKIWIAQLPKCEHSHIDVAPIDLTHLLSALYILVFGIHCSVCILIGEFVLNSFKNYWKLSQPTEAQYCG